MRNFAKLMRSTRGATAVEYGLILALIFTAAIGAMTAVGTSTIAMWNDVSDAATAAMGR